MLPARLPSNYPPFKAIAIDFCAGSRSGRYLRIQFGQPRYRELQQTVLLNHAEPGTTTQQSPAIWRNSQMISGRVIVRVIVGFQT